MDKKRQSEKAKAFAEYWKDKGYEKLSVRETERLVKELLNPVQKKEVKPKNQAEELVYKNLEEKIKQIIGSKVAINRRTDNKGKIEIEYYSQEELERIVELLETIG